MEVTGQEAGNKMVGQKKTISNHEVLITVLKVRSKISFAGFGHNFRALLGLKAVIKINYGSR
jgi:hypothetical protein